jgi:formiminotetrahydrofolate cyclodeaminase
MTRSALPDDLASLPVAEYLSLLSSDDPAPGGGSAAALCGAIGASLVQMICGINAKRAKNPRPDLSLAHAAKAAQIRAELLPLVTDDAKIYEKLSAVWKEKGPGLEAAVKEACQIPIRIGALSVDALQIAESEIENTSQTLSSDLKQAAFILYHIFKSAALHIDGNLKLMTDLAASTKIRGDLSALESKAGRLYGRFVENCR